jgi:hypothetical protein
MRSQARSKRSRSFRIHRCELGKLLPAGCLDDAGVRPEVLGQPLPSTSIPLYGARALISDAAPSRLARGPGGGGDARHAAAANMRALGNFLPPPRVAAAHGCSGWARAGRVYTHYDPRARINGRTSALGSGRMIATALAPSSTGSRGSSLGAWLVDRDAAGLGFSGGLRRSHLAAV